MVQLNWILSMSFIQSPNLSCDFELERCQGSNLDGFESLAIQFVGTNHLSLNQTIMDVPKQGDNKGTCPFFGCQSLCFLGPIFSKA